jgi:AraC-like DNA-binding protein
MLAHSALDVSQIAAMLDYADASAFNRALRRWSGTPPARCPTLQEEPWSPGGATLSAAASASVGRA